MGFNEFMTKLFGNKSQRDLKEITPYVDKIKAVYPSIQKLTNDELRAKTDEIKQRIQDYVADERAKVEELRKGIDNKELEEREAIWAEVDKIEKNITEKMEVVLEEVLPEVFSIMKDTALILSTYGVISFRSRCDLLPNSFVINSLNPITY